MDKSTPRLAMFSDVGLIGVAVFVAVALVAATLGAPAVTETAAGSASDDAEHGAPDEGGHGHAADPDDAPPPEGSGHEGASAGHGDGSPGDNDEAHGHAGESAAAPTAARDSGAADDGHADGHAPDQGHGEHGQAARGEGRAAAAGGAQDGGAHDGPGDQTGHEDHEDHEGRAHEDDEEGSHEGHGAHGEGRDEGDHDSHDSHEGHDGGQEEGHAAGHGSDDSDSHDGEHGDHEGHDEGGHEGHDGEHEGHGEDEGHESHGDHGDDGDGHDHGSMYAGCDDEHPETQRLLGEVQHSLEHLYGDVATLVAQGYIPYFDAQIPGGLATEGIGHWLNPEYIDNGVEMDPTRPESILTDEWYRPIGVMFIENNDGEDPTPVYVDEETGEACSPWHPHTDMPARIGWWYYRQVHDGAAYNDGEVAPDEVTPAMMHVWAVHNPHGVYAAHDHPPAESREGFPPPTGGYDRPATPLDEQLPDEEDSPLGPGDTCPHCPEGGDGDEGDHDGHDEDEGHEDDDAHDEGHEEDGHEGHDGEHEGHEDDDAHDEGHEEDGHEGHESDDGHRDHGDHDYYAGCDDGHPESVALREEVRNSLGGMYTDVAVLVAKGYVPYPDILLPGITHWLKPPQIYDERVMDPMAPESVLTDVWNRPVGMMFVEHPEEPAPPVYVADDGTECYPWHPHTDAPAVFAWNASETIYRQDPEWEDETPGMMHVWADNPHGMYAAHDYPPPSDGPGPLPSYLADTAVQEEVDELFQREEAQPVISLFYELAARIEEGVLNLNDEPPDLPTD